MFGRDDANTYLLRTLPLGLWPFEWGGQLFIIILLCTVGRGMVDTWPWPRQFVGCNYSMNAHAASRTTATLYGQSATLFCSRPHAALVHLASKSQAQTSRLCQPRCTGKQTIFAKRKTLYSWRIYFEPCGQKFFLCI